MSTAIISNKTPKTLNLYSVKQRRCVPYPKGIVCEDDMTEEELKIFLLRRAEESSNSRGIELNTAFSRLEEKYGVAL